MNAEDLDALNTMLDQFLFAAQVSQAVDVADQLREEDENGFRKLTSGAIEDTTDLVKSMAAQMTEDLSKGIERERTYARAVAVLNSIYKDKPSKATCFAALSVLLLAEKDNVQ